MEHNKNAENKNPLEEIFGGLIYSYSRADALRDGVLVDVTTTAREAGWKYPVAITSSLWADITKIPVKFSHEDVEGRLWDVLWMAAVAAKKCQGSRFVYELILHREGSRKQYARLVCDCGPGDNAEPVVTIGYREDF